ncbi:MAG: hypothetical protein DRO23_01285 [Thermoprotei archaeon]|nr:MAG: hypothetical protein DRO23_01285 [Thermoprotei archaeon]
MSYKALITLELDSGEEAKTVYEAILPEARNMPSERTRAFIIRDGKEIRLTVEADTSSSLRAALNSYLSWLSSIVKTVKYVREVETYGRKNTS